MTKPLILKILTAGDGEVGKTTLLRRYVERIFSAESKMTIGVEFFLKEVNIDKKRYVLQLWDFGGQDRFRFLLESYVLGVKGALLMFDLTRPITLENLEEWAKIIRKGEEKVPILLIGTKLDLESNILVDDSYVLQLKEKFNFIDYLKISSKTGENVDEVFLKLIHHIIGSSFEFNKELITSLIVGCFAIPANVIIDHLRNKYNVVFNEKEIIDIIENEFDGFSIGIDMMLEPNNWATIVPWENIIFYINQKIKGIPETQHDRLYFKDIRNSLYFPDHTITKDFKNDHKILQKLIYIIEECNNRGSFLRNIELTADSIEIPVLKDHNILQNLNNLKSTIETNYNQYKNSYLSDIYNKLDEIQCSLDDKLIKLIQLHRDKMLPELIEVHGINISEWDYFKITYNRWKEIWNRLKKNLRLVKVLVLVFKCDTCKKTYRFVYFEKTKLSKVIKAIVKIAPWAKNILNLILSEQTSISISIQSKPKEKLKLKENKENKEFILIPEEITFLYQTLIGIENENSLTLSKTFYLNKDLTFSCVNCINKK